MSKSVKKAICKSSSKLFWFKPVPLLSVLYPRRNIPSLCRKLFYFNDPFFKLFLERKEMNWPQVNEHTLGQCRSVFLIVTIKCICAFIYSSLIQVNSSHMHFINLFFIISHVKPQQSILPTEEGSKTALKFQGTAPINTLSTLWNFVMIFSQKLTSELNIDLIYISSGVDSVTKAKCLCSFFSLGLTCYGGSLVIQWTCPYRHQHLLSHGQRLTRWHRAGGPGSLERWDWPQSLYLVLPAQGSLWKSLSWQPQVDLETYLIWVRIILYAQEVVLGNGHFLSFTHRPWRQIWLQIHSGNLVWLIWKSWLLSRWCSASFLSPCFFLELHFLFSWRSVRFSPTIHGVTVSWKDAGHWCGDRLRSRIPRHCSRSA